VKQQAILTSPRSRPGDEAAFQSLIQRYHGPMLRLALTYVGDRGAAEDVVQETG
jgi:DNA-directed RNA polymerase specialized sigma24 family protein